MVRSDTPSLGFRADVECPKMKHRAELGGRTGHGRQISADAPCR
jgi:hypothetical protein